MKLVLVNRYFAPDESATSRMLTSLAKTLGKTGCSVHVLASRNLHDDPSTRLPREETIDGVTVHRIRTSEFGRSNLAGRAVDYFTFYIAVTWRMFRLLRPGDVCIACTDPPMLSVAMLLPVRARRGVLINWLMDLFPEVAAELGVGIRKGAAMQAALWLRDLSLRYARVNVAPIRRMTGYLHSRGIAREKLVTINHWSDGDALHPVDRQLNRLRAEWGLGGRFVVGYSGNFGRAHDFGTFLDAAVRLKDREDIVFVFVGGGHQKSAIEAFIREKGLANVLMKPLQPRERLAEALGVADLHLISLLPSMEPFVVPSKLYGILAAGRPAAFVGDVHGEIGSVLREGNCGRSVSPGDAEGLARIILELKDAPELAAEMGRNARQLFEAGYTEPAGTAAWHHVLLASQTRTAAHSSLAQPHDLASS